MQGQFQMTVMDQVYWATKLVGDLFLDFHNTLFLIIYHCALSNSQDLKVGGTF